MNRFLAGIELRVLLATFGLGLAGGFLGWLAGLPLGMMLGAMIGTGVASAFGLRVFGSLPMVPQNWRMALVPVIGVAIGARFPPDIMDQMSRWWITLVALGLFIPAVNWVGMVMFGRLGGLDRKTAFYGSLPGGLIEAVLLGEKAGADAQMLMLLQFLRLILTILVVPLAFGLVLGVSESIDTGAAVVPLGLQDAGLLLFAGAAGWWLAKKLYLPAPMLVGPLALSAALHMAGLTHAAPPGWMVLMVQWVIGTSLGVRFAGLTGAKLMLAIRLSAWNVAFMLAVATVIALVLTGPVGEPVAAVILAFAPGGVSEMSLVALSLDLSTVYVTLHHIARIVLSILVARALSGWINRSG